MDVSVIIINYNTQKLTSQCLDSIYKQTTGLDFEVILVDNASTECDADVFKAAFPSIKLIKSPTNTGFAGGNNLGLEVATGQYILLLNSDTELVNNAILEAWQIMRQDLGLGVLSGQLVYPDGRMQYPAGHFPSIWMELGMLFRVFDRLPRRITNKWYLSDRWDHTQPIEADWVWGAFFMMPRYVVRQLPKGKLPDDFFMYVEDMQWCFYIRQLGFTVKYSPLPKCIHHIGGSGGAKPKTEEELVAQEFSKALPNQITFMRKAYGDWFPTLLLSIRYLFFLTLRGKIHQLRSRHLKPLILELMKG